MLLLALVVLMLTIWQDPLVVNVNHLVSTAQQMQLPAAVVLVLTIWQDPIVINVHHLATTAQ